MPKSVKVQTLDRMFSNLIRESYDYICQMPGCTHCGNHTLRYTGGAECSHYHSRRYNSGRWHPDNCVCLCHQAHADIDQGPQADHVSFMIRHLGEGRHEMLVERLRNPYRYRPQDRHEMTQHYRAQLNYIEKQRKEGRQGTLPVVPYD